MHNSGRNLASQMQSFQLLRPSNHALNKTQQTRTKLRSANNARGAARDNLAMACQSIPPGYQTKIHTTKRTRYTSINRNQKYCVSTSPTQQAKKAQGHHASASLISNHYSDTAKFKTLHTHHPARSYRYHLQQPAPRNATEPTPQPQSYWSPCHSAHEKIEPACNQNRTKTCCPPTPSSPNQPNAVLGPLPHTALIKQILHLYMFTCTYTDETRQRIHPKDLEGEIITAEAFLSSVCGTQNMHNSLYTA
jgi:hypothetical protein